MAPAYSSVAHKRTVIKHCRCGLGDDWDTEHTTTALYNNLICDFSRQSVRVEECTDDIPHAADRPQSATAHWTARLADLSLSGFNHASCQCVDDPEDGIAFTTSERESTEFVAHKAAPPLVHIYRLGTSNDVFETRLAGVVAL